VIKSPTQPSSEFEREEKPNQVKKAWVTEVDGQAIEAEKDSSTKQVTP
jgi:hypothetical protein